MFSKSNQELQKQKFKSINPAATLSSHYTIQPQFAGNQEGWNNEALTILSKNKVLVFEKCVRTTLGKESLSPPTSVLSRIKNHMTMPPLSSGTIGLYNNLSAISKTMILGSIYFPRKLGNGFLTIGIPTIKRPHKESYLRKTLDSIIANTNEKEKSETVVVVSLSDFDSLWNNETAHALYGEYRKYFDSGFFHAIEAPIKFYPELDESKGYAAASDPQDRVKWRSKQNIDFAFLMLYSQFLSQFYIQLEDDVMCAHNFIKDIKDFIEVRNKKWACLEFSNLGFIGKLFHSDDLESVAHLILAFYQYLPCDILLGFVYRIMGQKAPIHYKPSLFQHIGKFSSLENKMMPSIDDEFKNFGKEPLNIMKIANGNNPEASIETDMPTVAGYPAENAYSHLDEKYFWAKSVRRWNYFQLKFINPQNITRIIISTGDEKKKTDVLKLGELRFSLDKNCYIDKNAKPLGQFVQGEYDSTILGVKIPRNVHCLQIVATKAQFSWLIIRRIEIFLDTGEKKR